MCSESNTKANSICVKTNDNTKLQSYKAAATYMETDSKYDEEDIEKMYCYPDGKSSRQLSQNSNYNPEKIWSTSKYLPEGWMCNDSSTKSGNICVKADDNTRLKSYKIALAFMEENPNKYTEDDMLTDKSKN